MSLSWKLPLIRGVWGSSLFSWQMGGATAKIISNFKLCPIDAVIIN